MPINDLIILRKGTETEWINSNPVLVSGEPGYDSTNNILKVGDGTSAYNNLPFVFSGVYLQNIIDDNSPALSNNLNINNNDIIGTGNIDLNGNITANSGNFTSLFVNTTGVALSGHAHIAAQITDFGSSVSGLLPANIVNGSGVANYISKWSDGDTLSTGIIYDDGIKIGIGTTDPSATLHVVGSGLFTGPVTSDGQLLVKTNDSRLTDSRTPTAHKSSHATGGSDALTPSDIGAAPAANPAITGNATFDASSGVPVTITNTGSGNSFVVNDASGDTTPFVVDSAGRVGIGNTSMSSFSTSFNQLVVGDGGTFKGATIYSTTQGTLAFGDTAVTTADGYQGFVAYIHTTDYMIFGTAGAERVRITSAGNVGIARGTPASRLDVNGVITVSAGTAAAPAIVASGDPNTGAFFPAADTFAISTAGSERVRVKSTGAVRFVPLASDPASGEAGDVYYNSTDNKLRYHNGSAFVGAAPAASPAITGNATFDASSGVPLTVTNTGTGNSFVVNDASGDTTPFVISNAGRVGVNTSSPLTSLDVAFEVDSLTGSGFCGIRVQRPSSSNTAFGSGIAMTALDDKGGIIAADGDQNIRFFSYTGAGIAERVRIDGSGNLLVGTTTASSRLTVNGVITVSATAGSAGSYLPSVCISGDPNTGFGQVSGQSDTASVFTSGHERVRVDSGGNVGIGTTSPATPGTGKFSLDVNGPAVIRGGLGVNQTSCGALDFSSGLDTLRIRSYGATAGTGAIDLRVGGGGGAIDSTAVFIASSRRVGIQTTQPDSALHVNGVITVSATSGSAGSYLPSLTISGDPNTGFGQLATDTASVFTAGHERVRVDSSGRVGIGATPSYAIDVAYNDSYQMRLKRAGSGQGGLRIEDGAGNFHNLASAANVFVITSGATERVRLDASGRWGIGTTTPTALLDINSNTMRLRTARTPASASASGNAGDICWDASYLYICTATDTWRRIAHDTW